VADISHISGLVASGLHQSSIPYAHYTTTTTHKTLRGPRGGMILSNTEELAKKVNSKIFPGIQGGPLEHIIAAKAVAFGEALEPEFKTYSEQVILNAKALADELMNLNHELVSGGTDNHLILLDLSNTEVTGKDAEEALDKAGITVNKNTVPNEKRSPFVTSGIRIGTPALTTRGMKEREMTTIAGYINTVLRNKSDMKVIEKVRTQVKDMCDQFPIY
jgi:glycine hydroxymethyltransferase